MTVSGKKRSKILVFLYILMLPCLSSAQSIGKFAGEFLNIGVGARSQSLGGAFVSIADDATASYWNPAGIGQLDITQMSLMHAEQFAGEIDYDFAGIIFPYRKNTTIGLSVIRLGIDGIPDTRNALVDSVQTNGRIDEGERLRLDRITYFTNSDYAVYLSLSHRKSQNFYIGGNVKIIRRGFGDFSAWGIGFDAAVLMRLRDKITVGVNLMDATTTMLVWDTGTKELISPLMKAGVSYRWNLPSISTVIRPAFDADIRFEGREYAAKAHIGAMSIDVHYGLEAELKNLLFLRTGIDDIDRVSFGVGAQIQNIIFDYSFTSFENLNALGNSHRVSLTLNIDAEKFRRR